MQITFINTGRDFLDGATADRRHSSDCRLSLICKTYKVKCTKLHSLRILSGKRKGKINETEGSRDGVMVNSCKRPQEADTQKKECRDARHWWKALSLRPSFSLLVLCSF